QVHDGDVVAIEVVAVRARDRVVRVERVLDDPDLHAVHAASSTSIDSTSSSFPAITSPAPPQPVQANHASSGSHSRSHASQRRTAGMYSCSSRAPSHSDSRETSSK